MSKKSNDQGRAYEFICLLTLKDEISKIRHADIVENSSYHAAERAWNTLSGSMQATYKTSSYVAVAKIFELEPRIIEKGDDVVELRMQTDSTICTALSIRTADCNKHPSVFQRQICRPVSSNLISCQAKPILSNCTWTADGNSHSAYTTPKHMLRHP